MHMLLRLRMCMRMCISVPHSAPAWTAAKVFKRLRVGMGFSLSLSLLSGRVLSLFFGGMGLLSLLLVDPHS